MTHKVNLLALHGLNEHGGIFDDAAKIWAKCGIKTYSYDHAGFGNTQERNRWAGQKRLLDDIAAKVGKLKDKAPDIPLFLLGHSLGGALSLLFLTQQETYPAAAFVDGLILLAPAVAEENDHIPFTLAFLKMLEAVPFDIKLPAGPFANLASDNNEMLKARNYDSKMIHNPRPEVLRGVVETMSAAFHAASKLNIPTLILSGDKDVIVPRSGFKKFKDTLERSQHAAQFTFQSFPEGHHMLIRDKCGHNVIATVQDWVLANRGDHI